MRNPQGQIGSRLQMWLKRLLSKGEKASPNGHAPSTKEKEHGREDRQKEFMDEQVRQRGEDESHIQDEAP
jgi:hypothetical protein